MTKQLRHHSLPSVILLAVVAACSNDPDQSGSAAEKRPATPQPAPSSQSAPSSAPAPSAVATAGANDQQKMAAPQTNADALLMKDFKDRIDAYMKLHDRQEKGDAKQKETSKPEKIKASQDALAAKIQAARKDAKPGDVFTPEIRQMFRRLMYPEMKGPDAAETKKTTREDEGLPTKGQILKVNSRYPDSSPLPTVPPNLLVRLPQLPEELEYRIVNKDLILRDVNANLIVDFIPNAIQ
jgi:hypothetical protein